MAKKKRRIKIEKDNEERQKESPQETEEAGEEVPGREISEEEKPEGPSPEEQLSELNDKYVRLYAEYENYRKKAAKDKEDLAKYIREEVVYELLPSLDHLEIALKHAAEDEGLSGLRQGVEMTLRELLRTLEKFGLKPIEAEGKPFDPKYHHAISQVETEEAEDKTVLEEFRKGYIFGDKVLRAAMVSVACRPGPQAQESQEGTEEDNNTEAKEE